MSFQTISLIYVITSVVGVETWYQPLLFNFLYRDLFTLMIVGKRQFTPAVMHRMCSAAETTVVYFCISACSFTVTLPMSLYNVLK